MGDKETPEKNEVEEEEITRKEVIKQVRRLKKEKVPGLIGIENKA